MERGYFLQRYRISVRAIYKNFFRNNFKSFPRVVHEMKKNKKKKREKGEKRKRKKKIVYIFIDLSIIITRLSIPCIEAWSRRYRIEKYIWKFGNDIEWWIYIYIYTRAKENWTMGLPGRLLAVNIKDGENCSAGGDPPPRRCAMGNMILSTGIRKEPPTFPTSSHLSILVTSLLELPVRMRDECSRSARCRHDWYVTTRLVLLDNYNSVGNSAKTETGGQLYRYR